MKMTPWFPAGVVPVRDGVYMTRHVNQRGPSDCWHAMRCHGDTQCWYSAGTTGWRQMDVIGWASQNSLSNAYEWRGLASKDGK